MQAARFTQMAKICPNAGEFVQNFVQAAWGFPANPVAFFVPLRRARGGGPVRTCNPTLVWTKTWQATFFTRTGFIVLGSLNSENYPVFLNSCCFIAIRYCMGFKNYTCLIMWDFLTTWKLLGIITVVLTNQIGLVNKEKKCFGVEEAPLHSLLNVLLTPPPFLS